MRKFQRLFLAKSICLVFAFCLFSGSSVAEEAVNEDFAWVRTTVVEYGKQGAYADLLKQISREAARQKWPIALNVYSPLVSNGAEFQIVSTGSDLAQLLDQAPARAVVKDMGVLSIIESSIIQIYRRRPDLERLPGPVDVRKVVGWQVYLTNVRQGKEAMEEEYLLALKRAADKVSPESTWLVSSPGINTGNVYRVAVPMYEHPTNIGNVNGWLFEAFGDKEARRLLSLRDDARESVERVYMRNRPDLSYYPQ